MSDAFRKFTYILSFNLTILRSITGSILLMRKIKLKKQKQNNKVLLYSTVNYVQYSVINHNGKEYEKECIYMCN